MSTDQQQVKVNAPLPEDFTEQIAQAYLEAIRKKAVLDFFDIDINGQVKRFRRRKILGKDRFTLETLRHKLALAALNNDPQYPVIEDELYKKMANCFLVDTETNTQMTEEQYNNTVFEDLKIILDALQFRTERPLPNPLGPTT